MHVNVAMIIVPSVIGLKQVHTQPLPESLPFCSDWEPQLEETQQEQLENSLVDQEPHILPLHSEAEEKTLLEVGSNQQTNNYIDRTVYLVYYPIGHIRASGDSSGSRQWPHRVPANEMRFHRFKCPVLPT